MLKEILGGDGELYLRTSNKGGQRPGRCAGRRAARYRTIQYSELLRRRLEVPTERALVLERALDLATWLDMDRPVLKLG